MVFYSMITFDENVRYTKSNEWAKKIDDVVRAGIDDYSQSSLGDIVHIEVSEPDSHVTFGKSFGSIEATKSVCDIIAPVSGVIIRVNDEVIRSPHIINSDPFGKGWIAEIIPDDISELDRLMNFETYRNFIQSYNE